MMRSVPLVLLSLLAAAAAFPPLPVPCQYGPGFVDECENQCNCQSDGEYACTRKGCLGDNRAEQPMKCEVDGEIRVERNTRFFCDNGIVRYTTVNSGDRCTPGASWKQECNTCSCTDNGVSVCTKIGCLTPDTRPVLPPQEPDLQFGDLAIASERPCPDGLQEGIHFGFSKVCLGQGCKPGIKWHVNGGCSLCVCTDDGEPACTPCSRLPTAETIACNGFNECPADCGRHFNAEKNCYDCPCGIGEPDDKTVSIDAPCPAGTDFRSAGAFIKACAPFDKLPKGNQRICEPNASCGSGCELVRVGKNEGCIYCQCGPELRSGDEIQPLDEACRSPLIPGPAQRDTHVCRAPTKEECAPGSTYNVECDICLCQEDGVPACTRRNCTLPKYGDVIDCHGGHSECPADCGRASSDSYCRYCQCGPRLDEGDIVIGIDEPCPLNFLVKEHQWATKTCAPNPSMCRYGPSIIDQCNNECDCIDGAYGCTRIGCNTDGGIAGHPKNCSNAGDLPQLKGKRVICHEGIVKVQNLNDVCLPGSVFLDADYCNSCFCSPNGATGCTFKLCITSAKLPCQYGPDYIDECGNECSCIDGNYGCTKLPCEPGLQVFEKPKSCSSAHDLPQRKGRRVICHEGIVKIQGLGEACLAGSVFMDSDYCNACSCSTTGAVGCTLKACL